MPEETPTYEVDTTLTFWRCDCGRALGVTDGEGKVTLLAAVYATRCNGKGMYVRCPYCGREQVWLRKRT